MMEFTNENAHCRRFGAVTGLSLLYIMQLAKNM